MTPKGFSFGAVEAAVKKAGRLDLGLMWSDRTATVAAVFTKSTVVAAPVIVSRRRAALGRARGVLVNSGNANACTGEKGIADAERLTAGIARVMGVAADEVLVCSTGVIGAPMPVERIQARLPALSEALKGDTEEFSRAIMTTDTVPKVATMTIESAAGPVTLTGVAKGAGMIRPDMATMLCFIATDADAGAEVLSSALREAVEVSFNRITIDGDTSTNDTVILLANGASGAPSLEDSPDLAAKFGAALESLCRELARMMVKDGEGVTKVVDVSVTGAASDEAAKRIAFTIAESPLVKTALHGEDPNWGRIAAAMGRSGHFAGGTFDILVGDVLLVADTVWAGAEAEAKAHEIMKRAEYPITVKIREGEGTATVVTCDFSAEYVKINADYRS